LNFRREDFGWLFSRLAYRRRKRRRRSSSDFGNFGSGLDWFFDLLAIESSFGE